MNRKQKRIFILTPIVLLVSLVLPLFVRLGHLRYGSLAIIGMTIALVTVSDTWLKSFFSKAYNRFAYLAVLLFLLGLGFSNENEYNLQEMLGSAKNNNYVAGYNDLVWTSALTLFWIFLIVYLIVRYRNYLDKQKYLKENSQRNRKEKQE